MFKFLLRPSLLFSKRTTQLKNLIQSKELEFIMEAHNGLSALIVQETGFKGIWASGLSMSTQLGVRDCNEASWTQLLEVLEFMAERTTIPILMDGDTGFGNYNNARRLVRKLEERGIAGVCFEDKIFPKRNSLGDGAQELANIQEFSNKIKACKDFQRDKDFQIVSRCESFIAGWGLENALERCEAYRKAGVDAVLIHSKKSDFIEIESFLKIWNNRLPVVIVPTNYYKTPTEEFRKHNVSLAIWANHNLRASIKAMQETSKQIFEKQHLNGLDNIATVKEVFRLQNEEGLERMTRNIYETVLLNIFHNKNNVNINQTREYEFLILHSFIQYWISYQCSYQFNVICVNNINKWIMKLLLIYQLINNFYIKQQFLTLFIIFLQDFYKFQKPYGSKSLQNTQPIQSEFDKNIRKQNDYQFLSKIRNDRVFTVNYYNQLIGVGRAYQPPIDTKHYSNLAIVLTFIGFCFLSYFVIYQITQNRSQRSLTKELSVGLFASLFLSSGTLFSFLALGFYF